MVVGDAAIKGAGEERSKQRSSPVSIIHWFWREDARFSPFREVYTRGQYLRYVREK